MTKGLFCLAGRCRQCKWTIGHEVTIRSHVNGLPPESWYRLVTRSAAEIRQRFGVPDQATEERMVRVFRAALRPRRKAGRKPAHATARAAEMWIAGMEEFH